MMVTDMEIGRAPDAIGEFLAGLDTLPRPLAAKVRRLVETYAASARCRHDRRDALLRELRQSYSSLTIREASREISRELTRYMTNCWPRERRDGVSPVASRRRILLHGIARANAGKSLGWEQIANILSGSRNPAKEKP